MTGGLKCNNVCARYTAGLTSVAVMPAEAPAAKRPTTPMHPSFVENNALKVSYAYSWVALYGMTFSTCAMNVDRVTSLLSSEACKLLHVVK